MRGSASKCVAARGTGEASAWLRGKAKGASTSRPLHPLNRIRAWLTAPRVRPRSLSLPPTSAAACGSRRCVVHLLARRRVAHLAPLALSGHSQGAEDEGVLYDVMDESAYAKLVAERRKAADFVVDDGTGRARGVYAAVAHRTLPRSHPHPPQMVWAMRTTARSTWRA